MSLINTLHLRTSLLLGSLLGLTYGCIITAAEPCDSGNNNHLDANDMCVCDAFHDWCNPDDDTDLNCCEDDVADTGDVGDGDGDGDGDTNTTGDGDGDTNTDSGTDTTGDGDGDGDGDTNLPPADCLPEEEGFYWCTHSEAEGAEGSALYVCLDGVWTENNAEMDEACMFDGYDFAYGCVDNGVEVIFECGVGSGEACEAGSPAFCQDDDIIAYCQSGKETWDSCMSFCQEVGIDGITYEYGECDDSVPDDVACFCCDSGDPGCPI